MPKNIPSPFLPDKGRKRIMRIIIEDPVLSLTDISFLEKGILALAHSFTKNGSRLYLSDEDLALPLCTHRTTVNKAVQKLVKLGYLEKRTELREGGKSYRSLASLIPEHSSILHLCSDEIDESIVANRYSHSSETLQCSPTIVAKRYSHSSESLHIIKSNLKDINLKEVKEIVADAPTPTYDLVTHGDYPCHLRGLPSDTLAEFATPLDTQSIPPWTESPDTLDTESTYKNNYKINNKIIDKSAVADAPSPSLSEPHRFVVSELTSEQRATLLTLLDGPARLAGHDPEKVLDGLLADCQRYSNGGNDKKRFRACWFETLKRQFVGKKIKDWAARPPKPLGASGLTYQQQQTCFRDFWNEAHGLDRPDLSWVTKQQGAFLQKLMGRLCGSETAYVEVLAKKRPDQFDYQCRDFTNAIKELEQELAK